MTTVKQFSDLLKEYYEVGALPEPDRSKYYLIERYEDRVSRRLLNEKDRLRKKGAEELRRLFRELIYHKNPFWDYLKKVA